MGHHYLPQRYLAGFSTLDDPALIWMYEKGRHQAVLAAISKVAQQKAFYTDVTEKHLADDIELPANQVLARLRAREMIGQADKRVLARYMVVMLKRVPRHRGRLEKLAPGVLASVFDELDEVIAGLSRDFPLEVDRWERVLAQAEQLRASYEEHIPDDLWRDVIQPRLSPRIVEVLLRMTWVFLTRDHAPYYLTGDNPVFYFEDCGLAKAESEVSFPIARDIALWATPHPDIRQDMVPADSQLVKEFNRRTISAAARFVFDSFRQDWVIISVNKSRHRLNRIVPGER